VNSAPDSIHQTTSASRAEHNDKPADSAGDSTGAGSHDESKTLDDHQAATVPDRSRLGLVDRPNRKLLRHRQYQARHKALEKVRANPINGDPIARSLRY
jgi:hypothetical protein